ncbi:hypothetical protein [Aeromonas veronii]|uniref:hypothetical protein n=1 Tax=Aeromonas veronii TaxID=654 RepID=UPI00187FFFE1|nr:hypothetical protein [Aeromonas veronii]MBE8841697.1 hypothetical protein [Aeromonas veronii]
MQLRSKLPIDVNRDRLLPFALPVISLDLGAGLCVTRHGTSRAAGRLIDHISGLLVGWVFHRRALKSFLGNCYHKIYRNSYRKASSNGECRDKQASLGITNAFPAFATIW